MIYTHTGIFRIRFDPPPSLPESLVSHIHVSNQAGGLVLTVEDTQLEHGGLYVCRAVGQTNIKDEVKLVVVAGTYTVTVVVCVC